MMRTKAPSPSITAPAMPTGEPTPFQLSRVYAKGWIDGSRSDLDPADRAQIGALNPYATEVERAKWLQGFTEAQARRVRR